MVSDVKFVVFDGGRMVKLSLDSGDNELWVKKSGTTKLAVNTT